MTAPKSINFWKVGLLGMSFMDMQPTVAYWSVFLFIGYVAVYVTTYISLRQNSCYIFKRCSFDKCTAVMLNTVNLLLYWIYLWWHNNNIKSMAWTTYFFIIFINFLASFPSINTTGRAILVVAAFNWNQQQEDGH